MGSEPPSEDDLWERTQAGAPLTEREMTDWLDACAVDPSIVTPHEMGYLPDGTQKRGGRGTEPPITSDEIESMLTMWIRTMKPCYLPVVMHAIVLDLVRRLES